MTQVYFRCSNPKEVLVDRCGGFAPLPHTDPRLLTLSFVPRKARGDTWRAFARCQHRDLCDEHPPLPRY